eukprot:COSAG04_NODE_19754_length_409_cov_0.654839_2_plen_42_part_01
MTRTRRRRSRRWRSIKRNGDHRELHQTAPSRRRRRRSRRRRR